MLLNELQKQQRLIRGQHAEITALQSLVARVAELEVALREGELEPIR